MEHSQQLQPGTQSTCQDVEMLGVNDKLRQTELEVAVAVTTMVWMERVYWAQGMPLPYLIPPEPQEVSRCLHRGRCGAQQSLIHTAEVPQVEHVMEPAGGGRQLLQKSSVQLQGHICQALCECLAHILPVQLRQVTAQDSLYTSRNRTQACVRRELLARMSQCQLQAAKACIDSVQPH